MHTRVAIAALLLANACIWDDAPDDACPQRDGTVCSAPDNVCTYRRGYPPGPVPGFGISLIGSPESYGCMPMPERCASTPTCACVMCTDEHACDADEDPSGCGDCFLFASCVDSSQGQPMVTFTEW